MSFRAVACGRGEKEGVRLQEQRHLIPHGCSHLFQGVGKWDGGSPSTLPLPLPTAQKQKGFFPSLFPCMHPLFLLLCSRFSSQ